jgi:hypothetical protein
MDQQAHLLSYCANCFSGSILPSPIADHVDMVLTKKLEVCKVQITECLNDLYEGKPGAGMKGQSTGGSNKLKDEQWLGLITKLRRLLDEQSLVSDLIIQFQKLPRESRGALYQVL